MSEIVEATMISKALEVFRLHTEREDFKLNDALEQVGITRDQYYYWIRKGEDVLIEFREKMIEANKIMLHDVINARVAVTRKIIEQSEDKMISLSDRITAAKYLAQLQEDMEHRVGVHGVADDEAAEFLKKGVRLIEAESRFTTINVTPKADGSVDISVPLKEDEIIDAYFEDNQNGGNDSEESEEGEGVTS